MLVCAIDSSCDDEYMYHGCILTDGNDFHQYYSLTKVNPPLVKDKHTEYIGFQKAYALFGSEPLYYIDDNLTYSSILCKYKDVDVYKVSRLFPLMILCHEISRLRNYDSKFFNGFCEIGEITESPFATIAKVPKHNNPYHVHLSYMRMHTHDIIYYHVVVYDHHRNFVEQYTGSSEKKGFKKYIVNSIYEKYGPFILITMPELVGILYHRSELFSKVIRAFTFDDYSSYAKFKTR